MLSHSGMSGCILEKLVVKADRNNDGVWELEHEELPSIDASGYAQMDLTHDAAGNLTYDGVFRYGYDAWNRLTTVTKGYRDGSGTLQSGSVVAIMRYDGLGRRIEKKVQNSGDLDCTYHYYHDGQRTIEVRNGSDQVIKQYVWNQGYIDDLAQTSLNDDPADGTEQVCESHYWSLCDSNYNVLGIVDSSGILKERYEYSPYGQRTVYFSPGSNDPDCYAPTLISRRWKVGSTLQPWGINEIGHQGLYHDEELNLIYNRARELHPILGRFMQRDPLGYIDGMNLYEYIKSQPHQRKDPLGLQAAIGMPVTVTGPKAGVISFIGDFDPAAVSVLDLIEEYQKATGKTLSIGRGDALLVAVGELATSANPAPAAAYTPPAWDAFIATKEYRGYTYFRPSICCAKGKVLSWNLTEDDSSHGYTPIRVTRTGKTLDYSGGEGWVADNASGVGSSCITISRMHDFRIGKLGQIVAKVLQGAGVPYAWHSIDYKLCCNGTSDIKFGGSNFPSHYTYINGNKVGGRAQKDLPAFMFAGAGKGAPGGLIP